MTVIMTYSAMNMVNWTRMMVPSRHQDGLSFLDSCLGSRQRELCWTIFRAENDANIGYTIRVEWGWIKTNLTQFGFWEMNIHLPTIFGVHRRHPCSDPLLKWGPQNMGEKLNSGSWTDFFLTQNRDHKMMFSWVKLEWHPLTPAHFRATKSLAIQLVPVDYHRWYMIHQY